MNRLVENINFGYGDMFVYVEANQAMQEPLEKLFKYEEAFNRTVTSDLINNSTFP